MAISENVSKKRGRPRLLSEQELAIVKYVTDAKSERHRQDVHYRLRAVGILVDDPRFNWLCDGERMQAGQPRSCKPTILAALGRIADDDALREVALALCKTQPKTREAVQIIRRWRLGKSKPGDALQLANEIIRTINDYMRRYPDTTWRQVEQAIHTAHAQVAEAEG